MLSALGHIIERAIIGKTPWTNVYGVARSLLALSTTLTLATSQTDSLFRPLVGSPVAPFCGLPLQKIGLFCLSDGHLDLARWLAVALLLVVASGWRPRLTCWVHWWISHSLFISGSLVDGGDQATVVLTLLLLPIAVTDVRRWHWQEAPAMPDGTQATLLRLVALSAGVAVRVQVAAIYFHSTVGKLLVPEWTNGTAMYYWLRHPQSGANPWLLWLVEPALRNAAAVSSLTWGVLVVEILLMMGLLAGRRARWGLLVLGIALHGGIVIFHGLASFAVTMWGALILYLRPTDEVFSLAGTGRLVARPAVALGWLWAHMRLVGATASSELRIVAKR
jgi:antimicrobial peptide system SdpB family protein